MHISSLKPRFNPLQLSRGTGASVTAGPVDVVELGAQPPKPGHELPAASDLPPTRPLPAGPKSPARAIWTVGGLVTAAAAVGAGAFGGLAAALAVTTVLGAGTGLLAAANS